MKFCENLVQGGYDDWRIPTIDELATLVRNCDDDSGCEFSWDGIYSVLNESATLWSSTLTEVNGATALNFFNFYTATQVSETENLDSLKAKLRCVRSDNDPAPVVFEFPYHDEETGLWWSEKSGSFSSYAAAENYCADLTQSNYGGISDWEVPTLEDYATVLDCTLPSFGSAGCSEISFSNSRSLFGDVDTLISSSLYYDRYNEVIDFSTGGVGVIVQDSGMPYVVVGNSGFPASNLYVRCIGFEDVCANDNPCDEVEHSTCTSRRGQAVCVCDENYDWNGSECVSFPYTDPDTNITWSATSADTMNWNSAVSYCENLEDGGYDDWRLPDIDEIRTLIRNCEATETGGSCGVTTSCSAYSGCWSSSGCQCSNDLTGGHSKFGDTVTLWSSTTESDYTNYAWTGNFSVGGVGDGSKDGSENVRCIRYDDRCANDNPCVEVTHSTGECTSEKGVFTCGCNEHYSWNGSRCVADSQNVSCENLPENAEWNHTGAITQTWSGSAWLPTATGFYSETAGETPDCSFRCTFAHTTDWNGSECVSHFSVDDSVEDQPVVFDRTTGLRWQPVASSDSMSWDNAVAYCEDLEYGGLSDWRLPNPHELLDILEATTYFTHKYQYWSGKTFHTDESRAIVVYVSLFRIKPESKDSNFRAICVHGEESEATSFIETELDGDDLVIDSNGLMWQKDYVENKTLDEAVSYCENLEYGGFRDWRLPDKYELASLFNFDKISAPYTDFPDIPEPNNENDGFVGSGYFIDFYGIYLKEMYSSRNLRCVRTMQESDPQFDNVYCTGLPMDAQWSGSGSLQQNWSGMSQWPSTESVYNEEPNESECRFKCLDGYVWSGEGCLLENPMSLGNICTGQTSCYNSKNRLGSCPAEGEDFYGQDAHYVSMTGCKPRSFSAEKIAGDYVVFDNNTGLRWQWQWLYGAPNVSYTWEEALAYCENLTYAGSSDWRLPSPEEIVSIV